MSFCLTPPLFSLYFLPDRKQASYQITSFFAMEQHTFGFLMKMIVDRTTTLFTKEFGQELPTPAQCRVLMFLESRKGEPVSQREIERHLGVSHTTAKGLLSRLEARGLVHTTFDSEDRRVKHAYLTDLSRTLDQEARRCVAAIDSLLTKGMSEEEIFTFRRLLEQAYRNVL